MNSVHILLLFDIVNIIPPLEKEGVANQLEPGSHRDVYKVHKYLDARYRRRQSRSYLAEQTWPAAHQV